MPNQMIALQARGGRVADPARITAQYANMMTAARQAEAAQTQGALARQTMANNQASEARAATAAITAEQMAKFEYTKGLMEQYTNRLATIDASDKARYSNLRQQIIRDIPPLENELPTPDEWNEKSKFLVISDAKEFLRYKYATPVASTAINDRTGQTTSITAGGIDPRAEVIGEVPFQSATSTAPRAAPTAPQAAGPVPAGEFGEARFVPEESIPLTPFQEEDIRRIQAGSGASQPASFSRGASAGQITPEVAQQIVDTAVKTGMMAQADFDQLMTLAPDQNKQPFMDMLKANNITLQPGGMGQQSQFADFRGPTPQSRTASLGDAPEVQTTMAQSQGRTPFIARREAPLPGSAQVPLTRVAGEAEARRETPAQIKARKTAELKATEEFEEANKTTRLAREREKVFAGERAKKDAAFLEAYSDATTKSRTTLDVIDQMIGDARLEKGRIVVPKGGRSPHPGFEGVVGFGIPGVRFFPGTAAAGFDALFEQAEGGAFLQAYESLRGTGQITEIEGTKATSALTRMKRSQSEVEFVKAAREFADVLRTGIERSNKRYTTLTGEAPAAAPARRKTPTKGSDGWGKAKVVGN